MTRPTQPNNIPNKVEAEVERIVKGVFRNGQWFSKHRFDRKPVNYEIGISWEAAAEQITQLIQTQNNQLLDKLQERLIDGAHDIHAGFGKCIPAGDIPPLIDELRKETFKQFKQEIKNE